MEPVYRRISLASILRRFSAKGCKHPINQVCADPSSLEESPQQVAPLLHGFLLGDTSLCLQADSRRACS